jgi:hypothetical protein
MIARLDSLKTHPSVFRHLTGLTVPAFDALAAAVVPAVEVSDPSVSHLFVSRRDRLGRPDNPLDSMLLEYQLRSAGLSIVLMGGMVLPPIQPGERIDLADLLTCLIDYNESGKFRRDLAEKLIHAKIRLAEAGYSIGGEPPYGFRRWLVAGDGTRKRQLEENERVKLPGHHVVWLPTAEAELGVVRRILDMIETTPAARIAKTLNREGVPSPKAGRVRKRDGVEYLTSGQWTQNTVRNIAIHPLLIAVCEYGKRSEGDQLRFTKSGPRPLGAGDYRPDGQPKTVANPDDQVIPLFADLRPFLTEAFELATPGQTHVVGGNHLAKANGPTGWKNCNLRTTFEKLVVRAGLEPWPRLFHNLRSSRETELLEEFPVHVVALWMGHDAKVSLKHYAQTTEGHFDKATRGAESGAPVAQNQAQQPAAGNRRESKSPPENEDGEAVYASPCDSLQFPALTSSVLSCESVDYSLRLP